MFAGHCISALGLVRATVIGVLICGTNACDRQNPPPPDVAAKTESAPRARAAEATRTENPAWPLGDEMLSEGAARATAFDKAINRLLDAPNIENLEQAQQTWREIAAALEQLHLFSRLGAVAPQDFQKLVDLQYNLTAWPIQPGYLDAYGDHPYSGIVFDVGMPLTAEALREQHGMTDNSDAALGVYAIEFILFGEQNNRGPLLFQPITALNDQYKEDGYTSVEELPRNRRRELLRLQAQLLAEDVQQLQQEWANNQTGQLKHKFELLTPEQQTDLLRKAALALATEQLVTVANQGPAGGMDLWLGQQLADRFAAQLNGLARLNAQLGLSDQAAAAITKCLSGLDEINRLPPLNPQGLPSKVNWSDTYSNLRDLIKALNPAPLDNGSESAANL